MNNASLKRRSFIGRLGSGLAATAAVAAVPAVHAQETIKWRMVTSWPKNSPGPGVTAQRLIDRIAAMSNGRLTIKLYAAGELVPAFSAFDAVAEGTADMAHTAAVFWQGKIPISAFFLAVPFGLTPLEHMGWIYHGGGQALWDELYAPFGIRSLMAGNTGMSMGGWFTREVKSLDDVKGLKYRIPGLGGEIMRKLGGLPVSIPPGEILPALQSGLVDGAEFAAPWSDIAFGFYKVAPYYYWPGFHEPNGTGECLINREKFDQLPADLQQIVENACAAENAFALAEAEVQNARALELLINEHGVKVRAFPDELLNAARAVSEEVIATFADSAADDISRRVYQSYQAVKQRAIGYSQVSVQAFLQARAGS
jgi:TRAP-type mannitol/chloroaromatic compound transport system substrate-binding protein